MRVLVVDEEIPYPLDSGKRLRTFNLLKRLALRHEIIFICRHNGEDSSGDGERFMKEHGITPIIVPHQIRKKEGISFYTALLTNLFSKKPYVVTSHSSPPLRDAITRIIKQAPVDLVHCEWTPYADNIRHLMPTPSVLMTHNVESVIWKRYFEMEKNVLKKFYIYLQWKKMECFERDALSGFTKIATVSDEDRKLLTQLTSIDGIEVVDNGVDTEFFSFSSNSKQKPHSLVFVGSLDWRPNIDCINYFLDNTWSRVLSMFPDCTLNVVGRRPQKALIERISAEPAVMLSGSVDDVRPFIDESTVYIVPLRIGGGSRLKILEAFAMGKPVVSTSVGAEGLNVKPEKDLLIADDPESFATAIDRLFNSQELRSRLCSSARVLVEKQYSWDTLALKLEKVWHEAAGAVTIDQARR